MKRGVLRKCDPSHHVDSLQRRATHDAETQPVLPHDLALLLLEREGHAAFQMILQGRTIIFLTYLDGVRKSQRNAQDTLLCICCMTMNAHAHVAKEKQHKLAMLGWDHQTAICFHPWSSIFLGKFEKCNNLQLDITNFELQPLDLLVKVPDDLCNWWANIANNLCWLYNWFQFFSMRL